MKWRTMGKCAIAGAAACMGATLFLATPGRAAWQMAETEHFRVYSDGQTAWLMKQAALLEDYDKLLLMMTSGKKPVDAAPKLDIFIVDRMSEARPYGRLSSDIAGFYLATDGRIAAFVDASSNGQSILLHEYAHHFMLGSGAVAYPKWYIEGFAEYFMTATFRPERIEFGLADSNRAAWLLNAAWQPLDRLISANPKMKRGEDRALFYAQSWLLTHYMFRAPGMKPKFEAYLQAVAAGEESVAAFRKHVDPDLPGLQATLRRYLTSRSTTYSRFIRSKATPASVTLTKLSPASDGLLMPLTSVELGLDRADGAKALADVRTRAASLPGDPLAQRTLALTEIRHGDDKAGLAIIDRLLAATPDDPVLLRWRAEAMAPYATAEDRTAARKLLARAFKADPNDWRTLSAYVALFDPMRRKLDKTVMDVLLRAYELAPQVDSIALTTAVALTHDGNMSAAAAVLKPIAHDPHGGTLAVRAAAMLARAQAGDQAGVLAALNAREADDYDDAVASGE